MNQKSCFVIPDHNHKDHIKDIVEALKKYQQMIFIVDDASDQETGNVLNSLEQEEPLVRVLRLDINQGKGGAVMHGLKVAYESGFTHALQVDADGQHNLSDVEHFLEQSKTNPQAIICGVPEYDESVPKGRLYGRYLTHVWVWIETLSFQIKDSMCGFRIYPLAPCIELFNQTRIGRRMDFDTEIIVRLYWQGLQVINIPTRVIYPEQGISHFNMFKDNLLITKMHTRLFFGMLMRLPFLLFRSPGNNQQHWARRAERGSIVGIRFMLWVYRIFGRTVFRVFLYPVMFYFFVTGSKERRASREYLQRVAKAAQKQNKPVIKSSIVTSFRHFLSFGDALIDKLAAWQGKLREEMLHFSNKQDYLNLIEKKQGAVWIGSHLGNLDVCRAFGDKIPGLKLNVLVFTEHAERFNRVMKEINPDLADNVIPVAKVGADTAILMKQKIEQGEHVVIVGDRTSVTAEERTQSVDFLGQPALFAEGPFVLASLMQCPVYLLFCLKEKGHYQVYFEHFIDRLDLPRDKRSEVLQDAIQRFANRLGELCIQSPLMWFNFFDFWKQPESAKEQRSQDVG
ncbi:MAG: glycosyltransferase family 2 protein [Gammaproteobacteria bacterium]|nr:glycosyltransferase family 2 protein [Gammaproteobacteria bacterium]MDH5592802.1 glycosyltransferase family 2 protein [Gammaproteobacteria bacterium]